jgi:hypothetical protein
MSDARSSLGVGSIPDSIPRRKTAHPTIFPHAREPPFASGLMFILLGRKTSNRVHPSMCIAELISERLRQSKCGQRMQFMTTVSKLRE